jgi:hypothetical protein
VKSELQVVKSLVKKYPNDMQLGAAVRRFLTEDYWIQKSRTKEFKSLKTYEKEWLEQLEKI